MDNEFERKIMVLARFGGWGYSKPGCLQAFASRKPTICIISTGILNNWDLKVLGPSPIRTLRTVVPGLILFIPYLSSLDQLVLRHEMEPSSDFRSYTYIWLQHLALSPLAPPTKDLSNCSAPFMKCKSSPNPLANPTSANLFKERDKG